jgi:hypothetical protein
MHCDAPETQSTAKSVAASRSQAPLFPVGPFAAKLVFPDVEPDVLEREDAVQSTSVWTAFLARTLPHAVRPQRLRPLA